MQPPNVAKLRLWNPMTGHVVPVRDPSCELREVSIGCMCSHALTQPHT
jgi:hypothetical protein